MHVEYLNPPGLVRSPAFSHAVVVEHAGRTVYVGGQNGVDPSGTVVGGVAEQTVRALDNVRIALEAAGAELADVFSWSVAITSGEDLAAAFSTVQPAIAAREKPPIVNVLQVSGLAVPGCLVELSAIAVLP